MSARQGRDAPGPAAWRRRQTAMAGAERSKPIPDNSGTSAAGESAILFPTDEARTKGESGMTDVSAVLETGFPRDGHRAEDGPPGPVILGTGDYRYEVTGANW